jgi:hypothetical protein
LVLNPWEKPETWRLLVVFIVNSVAERISHEAGYPMDDCHGPRRGGLGRWGVVQEGDW